MKIESVIHIYIYIYTYTYIHIYACIHIQVLLQVLNERQFGFHFRKFVGQVFAVLIHTFNTHILRYRHKTCLFGRKSPLLSSRAYTGLIF